jgi:hypothetical protein
MATKKSHSEVQELKKSAKKNNLKKPVLFSDLIGKLKKGEGILIKNSEWKLKTPIPGYYYSKYNKKGTKTISCTKVDEGYLIEKIK